MDQLSVDTVMGPVKTAIHAAVNNLSKKDALHILKEIKDFAQAIADGVKEEPNTKG